MILLSLELEYIIAICIVLAVIIISGIVTTIVLNKNKKDHVVVDEEFLNNIISWLGGKENICGVSVDNARLKVSVKDVEIVDSTNLHSLSEKGVFITGNNVKLLFKYDSQLIQKEINKRL